jgi:hypothetical protein
MKTSICGNDVEGDLLGELGGVLFLTRDVHALGLVPQLVHAVLAGAGHGLVGRDHHALDLRAVMQGFSATTICAVEQLGLAMMFFFA